MAVLYEIKFLGLMMLKVVVRFMDYAFGQIHVTILREKSLAIYF